MAESLDDSIKGLLREIRTGDLQAERKLIKILSIHTLDAHTFALIVLTWVESQLLSDTLLNAAITACRGVQIDFFTAVHDLDGKEYASLFSQMRHRCIKTLLRMMVASESMTLKVTKEFVLWVVMTFTVGDDPWFDIHHEDLVGWTPASKMLFKCILKWAEQHLDFSQRDIEKLREVAPNDHALFAITRTFYPTCAALECDNKGEMACSLCLRVMYCRKSCQITDLDRHKTACVKPDKRVQDEEHEEKLKSLTPEEREKLVGKNTAQLVAGMLRLSRGKPIHANMLTRYRKHCGNKGCNNVASKTCAGCSCQRYCSQECQKMHWQHGHYRMCHWYQHGKALKAR